MGAALLDRCPTLRSEYASADGSVDGLSALCNLMREEQAGEIWEALGAWCSGGEGSKDRRPKLGDDVIPRLMWARDTATSESYALGQTRRQQARAEVKSALNAMLSDGSVLCFIPRRRPPPPLPTARSIQAIGPVLLHCKGQPASRASLRWSCPQAPARTPSCRSR